MKYLIIPILLAATILAGCGGAPTYKGFLGRVYTLKEYRDILGYDVDMLTKTSYGVHNSMFDKETLKDLQDSLGFKPSEANIKTAQEVYSMNDGQLGVWMRAHSN